MRGLRTKLLDLKSAILCSATRYDIIVFVETWLNASISSSELGLDEFNIFRVDRSPLTSSFSRGGGVLVAIRNTLSCSQIAPNRADVEQVFVRVRLQTGHLIVGALYLPPASQPLLYENHVGCVAEILQSYRDDGFCILGDYNLPHADWSCVPCTLCSKKPGISSQESTSIDLLQDGYNLCNLAQMNTIVNAFDNMLDLIFVSDTDVVVDNVTEYIIAPDPYHPPLKVCLRYLLPSTTYCQNAIAYKDFKNGDYRGMVNYLNAVDWDLMTDGIHPDAAVDHLYAHLHAAIDAFIPVKFLKSSSYPRWFSSRLKKLIYDKKIAHKAYKTSNSRDDYLNFSNLRAQCKFLTKKDYSAYVDSVECKVRNNVKSFWNFVNAKRGNL